MAETTVLTVKERLSKDQRVELLDRITKEFDSLAALEERKAQEMKDLKDLLNDVEGNIKQLVETSRRGYTEAEVECRLVPDWDRGMMTFVRTDTGEVVEEKTRALTAEDRQLHFDGIEGQKQARENGAPAFAGGETQAQ